MSKKNQKTLEKIKTPMFRVSFPEVFEPKAFGNSTPKFSIQMLFDPENFSDQDKANWKAMKDMAQKSTIAYFGSEDKIPENFQSPFKDAALKLQYDGYEEGMIFVNASTKFAPAVVDAQKNPIMEHGEFYGGCYAWCKVDVWVWEYMGNSGIKFQLGNIQKIKDGNPFGNKSSVDDDFDAIETASVSEEVEKGLFD